MAYRGPDEPVSQVMQSMENLDVSSMRPDIKVVRSIVCLVKLLCIIHELQ